MVWMPPGSGCCWILFWQKTILQTSRRKVSRATCWRLTRLHEEPDLEHAVKKGLEGLSSLLDAGLIGIYQAESDQPRLRKLAAYEPASVFPEEISSSDLVRLASTTLWVPGKRVNTDIHRVGKDR